MIRKCCVEDIEYLKGIIKKDIFQNVYLYIDTSTYGFENQDIQTWIISDSEADTVIVYKYYNSLQIFGISDPSDENIREICFLIEKNDSQMLSGSVELIRKISCLISEWKKTEGIIMKAGQEAAKVDSEVCKASADECYEIASLICADEGIGGHYSVALLEEQLQDRMKNWHCQNFVLKENGTIVAHMGTYADVEGLAVLGGLVTAPAARGQGYGKRVLQSLTAQVIKEQKVPVLYCYEQNVMDWYRHLGWTQVYKCAKLERK